MAPQTLSALLGEPVTSVSTSALLAQYSKSGSRLEQVQINDGQGTKLILKHVSLSSDWLMRVTNDRYCRSVTLWTHGLLDKLPSQIDHAIIACTKDKDGWAILLRDVSGMLLPNTRFSIASNAFMLQAMADLHATFFKSAELSKQDLGLCRLRDAYSMFSLRTGKQEINGTDEVPIRIVEGWEMVKTAVPSDVADLILDLVNDSTPLVEALSRYPHTLVHGDWRHANQGLQQNGHSRLILLDWQLAVHAPPAVELGRGLGTNSVFLPVSKEEAIAIYKRQLAQQLGSRFSESWWEPQLALALLGGFVQDGWAIALKATNWHVGADARDHWRADLAWWTEQVRAGAKWL